MFDLDLWKKQAIEVAANIEEWIAQQVQIDYSTYSTLVGIGLWPLVTAAGAAGKVDKSTVLPHLYMSAISMGSQVNVSSDFIAQAIQLWFDQAKNGDLPKPKMIQVWVSEQLKDKSDAQLYFDHLLSEFDLISAALASKNHRQLKDFYGRLTGEMQQLNNYPQFANQISESVRTFEPISKEIDERGVNVDGNVNGNLITGDNNTVTYIVNHPKNPSGPLPQIRIEGPRQVPIQTKAYFKFVSSNAVRATWSIGGLDNNKVTEISPLGPSHEISAEPTDPERIGDFFQLVVTAQSQAGSVATAEHLFQVVDSPSKPQRKVQTDFKVPQDRTEIYRLMTDDRKGLSREDFNFVCLQLEISPDNLSGSTVRAKTLDLIQFLERRSRYQELLDVLANDFGHLFLN
ncbi:MAG: hypothetical protein AAF633_11160 [Chloroflexota bacterium]